MCLDFPFRFVDRHDGDDKNRPVIIHRAILGSVERMMAILTENFGGKWWVVSDAVRSQPPLPFLLTFS